MNDTIKKLLKRQSELQEKTLKLTRNAIDGGGPIDVEHGELGKLMNQRQQVEQELQVALDSTTDAPPSTEDGEDRAFGKLVERASLTNYIECAIRDQRLEGAELELQQATGCDKSSLPGLVVPWEAFYARSDDEEPPARGRVGDVSLASSDQASVAAPWRERWIGRIFRRSDLRYLGISMRTVGVGDDAYIMQSAGGAASVLARGAAPAATAATFTVDIVKPQRLASQYVFRVEDLVRFRGYEGALRRDMSMMMQDKLDDWVLTDDAGAVKMITDGFSGVTAANFDARNEFVNPGAAPFTAADFRAGVFNAVDNYRAHMYGDFRILTDLYVYRHLGSLSSGNSGNYEIKEYASVRGTDRLARLTGNKISNVFLMSDGIYPRPGIEMPVWQGVGLIRDIYSGAGKGEVTITATMLFNLHEIDVLRWGYFRARTVA